MAVFKIEKNRDFTVMSNYHLRDKNLSLKAKGLLSFCLSLPENWDYSLDGLVSVLKEGVNTIETCLKELKENGYVRIDKLLPNQTKSKKIEYVYNIFEKPMKNQDTENQEVEKQGVENQGLEVQVVENPPQINTNIINTNINNNICPFPEKFDELWKLYPRKEGRASAFRHYSNWIKGKFYAGKREKLTDAQMRQAIKEYLQEIKENKTEEQFIKMGSTFFNEAIFEYANKGKNRQKEETEKNKQKTIYKENYMSEEEYYSSMKDKGKRYE